MNFRNAEPSSEAWRMRAPAIILALGITAAAVANSFTLDKTGDTSVCGPVEVDSEDPSGFDVTVEFTETSVSYRVIDEDGAGVSADSDRHENDKVTASYVVPSGNYTVDAQIGSDGKEGCIIPVTVE